jgi:hypothetical protein
VVIGQWFENMVKIPLFLSNARGESMVKYTQKVM